MKTTFNKTSIIVTIVIVTIVFVVAFYILQTNKEDTSKLPEEISSRLLEPVGSPIIAEQELSEINTIRKYYSHLAQGELEQAYSLYAEKTPEYGTYVSWYEDVVSVNLVSVDQMERSKYNIRVDLIEKWPGSTQSYNVVMEVADDKIRTLSSEQIIVEPVTIKDATITSRVRFGKSQLIAKKNGTTTIIDEADADFLEQTGTTRYFFDIEPSPSGKYFSYTSVGWEWGEYVVVDFETMTEVARFESSLIGFSSDESLMYQCTANDLAGTHYAHIYSVPEFEKIETLLELNEKWIIKCNITNNEVLEITYSENPAERENRLKTYNLRTGETTDVVIN